MSEVAERMKRTLEITGGNPDAVGGNTEAWVNCDFCSNRREVCTKDTEWEPCPRCSTRPLAPVPTKPKECKCEEHGGFPVPAEFAGILENMPPVIKGESWDLNEMLGKHTLKEVCEMRDVEYDPKQDPASPEYAKSPRPAWDISRGKTVFIDEPSGQLPNCLQTADRITSTDRNEAYGHPLDDFECTAEIWTAILRRKGLLREGVSVDAETSQLMMVGVKISREAGHHKADNLIDGSGYFRTIEMTIQERERRALAALEELTRLGQEQVGYEVTGK